MNFGGPALQPRARRPGARSAVTAPASLPAEGSLLGLGRKVLIILFLVSLMLPIHATIGSLRMTPFNLYLLIAFLPLLVIWLRQRLTPLELPDYLIVLFSLWAGTSVLFHHGNAGVEPAGIHLLQTVGAYLLARLLIRDRRSMRFLIEAAVLAVLLLLPFAVVEALTGRRVIIEAASSFAPALAPVIMDPRMGLTRVQGPFEHPILFGIYCASLLSPAFYLQGSKGDGALRWIRFPAVAVSSMLSLSTGALLALNIQLGLMVWGRALRTVKNRWRILGALLAVMYVTADVASNRTPFHLFVSYATFSSKSSYNRINIWNYGTAEVWRHPLFGIGFNDWARPSWMSNSMDNFWLVQAVRYGLPALAFLFAAMLLILLRTGRQEMPNPELEAMRRGANYSLIATLVAISSSHLWNASYVWLMFLFGATVWLGQLKEESGIDAAADAGAGNAAPAKNRLAARSSGYRRSSFR